MRRRWSSGAQVTSGTGFPGRKSSKQRERGVMRGGMAAGQQKLRGTKKRWQQENKAESGCSSVVSHDDAPRNLAAAAGVSAAFRGRFSAC